MDCMGFFAEVAWLGQTKLPQSLWACFDEQLGTQTECSNLAGDPLSLNSQPVALENRGEPLSAVEPSRLDGNSTRFSERWFRRLKMRSWPFGPDRRS
jgi:hypothetical protein